MLAGALVMLISGTAAADFTMKSTSCKFVGMVPGKKPDPIVNPGNGFSASCERKGVNVSCTMAFAEEGKDAYTLKKHPVISFEMAPVDGGSLMISADHLNFVLFDTETKRFAWAQTFVDAGNGIVFQKSCIGDYEPAK